MNDFFSAYEKAFSSLDVQKQAEMFADTFFSAGPKGTIAQTKAEFLKLADSMAEYYRNIGQQYAKVITLHEIRISNEYTLVNVHWGARFKKIPDRLIEFDVSYLVQHIGGKYEILLFIAHQDEEAAMKQLGVLTEKPAVQP